MKPKNNRIIANRFRAQRLMQQCITIGPYTQQGRRLVRKVYAAMNAGRVTLRSMGVTCCRQDRPDHRKAVRAARAVQSRFTG